MTAPKRLGMTAKTPAQRQAERRARGAKAVMLPGDVLAQLDAITVRLGAGTRVECIKTLVSYARQSALFATWHK